MPVYIVDKPLGLSSHDVVAKSRKALQTRKVGHAGTLDPLATGVLVILAEEATKLSPFLTASTKSYLAWVSFGGSSPTLDAEGPLENVQDASQLTLETIQKQIPTFLDLSEQLPPQYSAIKQGGKKAYDVARQGDALDLPPRPVRYHTIECLGFSDSRDSLEKDVFVKAINKDFDISTFNLPEPLATLPTALFYISVQAGTYIRSFARDLGEAVGIPAHLSGLVRTQSGQFSLDSAVSLENLADTSGQSMIDALDYPIIQLNKEESKRIQQGQRLSYNRFEGQTGRFGLASDKNELIAVAETVDYKLKLLRVWNSS